MRQRYNETNWDLDYLTDDPSPRFVGQKIGAKLIPPTLFLFFKDLNNGKYKRRKMPIRDFADNVGAQQLTSDEVAQNLVTRHDVLAIVPRERLVSLLEKIRTHGGTLDKSRKVLKSIEPLPKLPSKMGPPPIYKESDKNVKGSKGNAGDLKVPIDGSVNLNKFSDDALSKVKSKMDVDFVKHQVKPGDARFQYDKQSFGPPIEDNEWDEQSGSSKSKRVLEPKSKPAFGDLETDNSTDASNIDDELSALLGDDLEKPNVNDKSFQNDRDEESGAASKSAFWWMKKDGDEDDSKSDALSKKPQRYHLISSQKQSWPLLA
ncbi:CEP19-like protein-domain-containing protein [Chytriomyces sp. MP71]|nr:CEP19-like protein-domain-containing protein [Chytriomyces sp. MP71]